MEKRTDNQPENERALCHGEIPDATGSKRLGCRGRELAHRLRAEQRSLSTTGQMILGPITECYSQIASARDRYSIGPDRPDMGVDKEKPSAFALARATARPQRERACSRQARSESPDGREDQENRAKLARRTAARSERGLTPRSEEPTERSAGEQEIMVRVRRLELPRVAPLEPKSSASTNSATPATLVLLTQVFAGANPLIRSCAATP